MRCIVIDWMISSATDFTMAPEVIFLAVNYMDRYLSLKEIPRGNIQLLGVVCLLIAHKFDGTNTVLTINDAVMICDGFYTRKEVSTFHL